VKEILEPVKIASEPIEGVQKPLNVENQESLSDLDSNDEYINNRTNIKNQIFGHYEKVNK
jgi:hypothetical protein